MSQILSTDFENVSEPFFAFEELTSLQPSPVMEIYGGQLPEGRL